MLTGLRPNTISSSNNKDSAIHLGGTSDPVLDVVGMARAVDVGVVTGFRIVFDVSSIDGDTTGLLLRCGINLIIVKSFR